MRAGGNDAISAHFVGSIVYIEKGLYQVSAQTPLLVIDGQQRLTTISLLLEALARQLGETEPVDGFSAKKIRSYYLLNALEDGQRRFKLLLTQNDKATLLPGADRRDPDAIPTNSLNKTFATFGRTLKKDHRYLESVQAHLLTLPSYRRFPGDDEFERDLKTRDLYNFRSRSYWLRRLENHGRKERANVDEYTIEHILPQNENLSEKWRDDLGAEWQRVQQERLHTLGNLTLTGYNSEYSDRPFSEKRDMPGGFKQSPLRLNEDLGDLEVWDEAAIKSRADKLARQAASVWTAPHLDADVLEAYRPKQAPVTGYSLADHDHLAEAGPMREVFDLFRKQVLSLDPAVTEEFLKLYVAYKAETNFVDVVPQAKRLRLSLNMDFHELHDPAGIATDVTNKGRWGNGNVEIALAGADDLPYVMGLVRQSLEKRMGENGSDAA